MLSPSCLLGQHLQLTEQQKLQPRIVDQNPENIHEFKPTANSTMKLRAQIYLLINKIISLFMIELKRFSRDKVGIILNKADSI